VKTRCCRATPRCAGCPVLLIAARRRNPGVPDLFAEILGGRTARALPESVVRALAELERRPERPLPPGRFERTRAADLAYSDVEGVAVAGASCSPDEPDAAPDPWPEPPRSSGQGWPSPSRSAAASS
jgi:hypothetical protein